VLIQWRYKICKGFATCGGELIDSGLREIKYLKPRPKGLLLYNITKRKYDYVDYTGKVRGVDLDVTEFTCLLEVLGYIKFIDRRKINDGEFTEQD
jgi:hypothetical protein